ncbi:MAG TPA: hypothetical protein VKG21_21000 [Casimicrobiaceae bacterium]|nr:hypothetical protein [Casimicrobiaceae bacterium]
MRLFLVVIALFATFLVRTGWAQGNPSAPQGISIKGEVLEVMDVDAFTYLRDAVKPQ